MAGASKRSMTALQRFAALGLPDRLAFPALVALLGELVPFETAAMLWLDGELAPIDTFTNMDAPPVYLGRYAERWFDREERRFHPTQRQMQTDASYAVIRVSDHTPRFGETELYDEVYRPAQHHWIVGLALRDGGRPIGNLGIGRPPGAPDFTDEELRRLRLARPFVVQALANAGRNAPWSGLEAEDEAGMVVVNDVGRILHATPGVWRLLHEAAGAPAGPALLQDRVYAWARPLLASLVARVREALRGGLTTPARLETETQYGRFVLRAYVFESDAGDAKSTFGVQIEKHLPAPVRMVRSARFRALTPREQDIGRLLATGHSYPRIAEVLGVEASTVVTHVRNLGDKLRVSGRDEIVRALCD